MTGWTQFPDWVLLRHVLYHRARWEPIRNTWPQSEGDIALQKEIWVLLSKEEIDTEEPQT